ncbi:HNH endonuclease [Halohasta litorea]|uniref:HNH endonuclease n=1 Tax=Halohasta litorea TaxID=869891 RepID=A0ABD6D722_9EURY|nr:HNH endonuclease [Halohasta litorea]
MDEKDHSETGRSDSSPYESVPSPDEVGGSYESISTPNEVDDDREEYLIEGLSIKPTSSDNAAAYEYEDLKRSSDTKTQWVHIFYWPIYTLFIFPIQYIIRAFMWGFWKNWDIPTKIMILSGEAKENFQKLSFLGNPDRRAVYLRASRVYTPAQLFPFVPGSKPIPEDSTSERLQAPNNWNKIRKQVYKRDGHTCVNCGEGGGPNGTAELHADHVLPRSRNGPNTLSNLRTLCRECHEARHARKFN